MIGLIDPHTAGSGPTLVPQVEEIFSREGLLSASRNFEYRPQQQEMAVAVARALERGEHLVVEAGTGVGKSLAYLIPSILFAVDRKKKAVISTHTINLQEQLVQKDLPMLQAVLPVSFTFTMLKGRGNYLCTRRLRKAMQQADSLFTSPEAQELQRIYEWSRRTEDGSLSDFDTEPDPKVWTQVCSERGLCSPKVCGAQSDFAKDHGVCFFQRARSRILSSDVLVLNHTLFFTLLGGMEEESEGGMLFKNDFVVFDEAHTVEQVASKHIGFRVSNGQVRFALQRLWNPHTEKGLLATLNRGQSVKLVADVLSRSEEFFHRVENACEEIVQNAPAQRGAGESGGPEARHRRQWTELRIRRPDLVQDEVTLPLQRLREGCERADQDERRRGDGAGAARVQPAPRRAARSGPGLPQPERERVGLLGRTRGQGAEAIGSRLGAGGYLGLSPATPLRQSNFRHHDQCHAGGFRPGGREHCRAVEACAARDGLFCS